MVEQRICNATVEGSNPLPGTISERPRLKNLMIAVALACLCVAAAWAAEPVGVLKKIKAAKARKCDLIFMASHGRSGIAGLLIGSEANKVLTHCRLPVLVYR